MRILQQEINFDRFVRGLLLALLFLAIVLSIRWLSAVLMPFLVAWVFAWILIPIVRFFQFSCRLRSRTVAVALTLTLATATLGTLFYLTTPLIIEGITHLKDATLRYLQEDTPTLHLPAWLQHYVTDLMTSLRIEELLRENSFLNLLKSTLPHVWGMLLSTFNIVAGLIASMMGVLYLLFLLIDYERYAKGWLLYVPQKYRAFLGRLTSEIEHNMRGYFRGQALIALWNCLLFSLGFWIIGLPMPIGMGCFVGLISFIPYVQVVGFLPAALLALLQMAETGRSFWMIMFLILVVYVVVQIIQDVFILPKVMGGIMGLRPAIILLSLSVWGYMGGIVGLIVALPLTTLLIAYYKRYIIDGDTDISGSR